MKPVPDTAENFELLPLFNGGCDRPQDREEMLLIRGIAVLEVSRN